MIDAGAVFETLVGLLLKKLYPNYTFEHTKYRHDGGKDYYAVFDNEKIWAEAKCHNRHLELSRIAGTFIMAEIFKINQVIVFSEAKLSKGTLTNLSRYASMNLLTLIVYQEADIIELVKSFGKVENKEMLDTIINTDNQFDANNLGCSISELTEKIKGIKEGSYTDSILLLCAYKRYEEYLNTDITSGDRKVKLIDNLFYKQGIYANPVPLENEIKAFETFSSEIILRNENLKNIKEVKISYENSTRCYNLLTSSDYIVKLAPCQCVCIKFYFKSLNDSINFSLPKPKISADNKKIYVNLGKRHPSPISCLCVGEISYIGKDSEKLSQCCINLDAKGRQFSTVCVYGKSGVGKSRFLTELYYARQKLGNKCYIIKGENNRNSLYDFLRALIYGIYSFNYSEDGAIVFSESIIKAFKDEKVIKDDESLKSLEFINSILKSDSKNNIDTVLARNWLSSIIKNRNITLLVDNTQFIHKDVLGLLRQVCNDLQFCCCNSEIVFAFNTDFMPTTSIAYSFLTELKSFLPDEFIFEIEGFNENAAVTYLKYSLDPNKLREDLEPLCKNVVDRLGCNPLFLKQIVLYLYQKTIIGFYDNTLCILDFESLQNELEGLPRDTHTIINLRYETLLKQNSGFIDKIKDLFWSVLIFDKFPKLFLKCIPDLPLGLLKTCIELGFLKSDGENITFEHQLIAKSILISIQEDAYSAHPIITHIGLSEETKNKIIGELRAEKYSTIKFALEYDKHSYNAETFSKYAETINLKCITDIFTPYIINAVENCVCVYNEVLSPRVKIEAIYRLITDCQNKLGVQSTQKRFKSIIDFQIANFELNCEYVEKFIDLLKFYIHELPPYDKSDFILEVRNVGVALLTLNNKNVDDFQIWIMWALGKSYMHVHEFNDAFSYLDEGVKLAQKTNNFHRLAELNVQLGYLSAYQMQKCKTAKYWETASKNFNKTGIYDEILALVYRGNVLLLKNKLESTEQIINKLLDYYENKDCYAFLKSVINNFICDKLILQFVKNKTFDINLDQNIKKYLKRFRSQTMTYNLRAYMLASYKTLTYLNYIIKNFSEIREEHEVEKDYGLAKIVSTELLSNYDDSTGDFNYFYPILKDITMLFEADNIFMRELNLNYPTLLNRFNPNINLHAKYGILSDKEHKVNLLHYSYTW